MAKQIPDQADGLRKLAGQGGLQIISILSGSSGAGKTIAAANLASALSRAGRAVKLVGMLHAGERQMKSDIGNLDAGLSDGLPDIILVDPPSGSQGDFPDIQHTEIVIVLEPDTESITSSYALVKLLSGKYGIGSFHMLLNRALDESHSASIANNFAEAAERYLGVSVHYLGHVARDPQLEQAARLKKSVIEAFPVAESARQFRYLAEKLVRLPRLSNLAEMGETMRRMVISAAC